MQNPGLSLGSVSFQGVQLLWLVVVGTIVLALVSVTRVSYVSVGWTWRSKPGQVRVRVLLFSPLLEDGIITASGIFSAEILNCSAVSSSDDASNSISETVFIFKKTKPLSLPATTLLLKQSSTPMRAAPEKIVRKRSKSLDFQKTVSLQQSKSLNLPKIESLLLSSPQSTGFQFHVQLFRWRELYGMRCQVFFTMLLMLTMRTGPRQLRRPQWQEPKPL